MTEPRVLFAHILRSGANEALRRSWIVDTPRSMMALRIALLLSMQALIERSGRRAGGPALGRLVTRNTEDLFGCPRRLSAADVQARGNAILEGRLKRGMPRAVEIVAALGGVDEERAAALLAMFTAASISALSKLHRDVELSPAELRGVLKCEAVAIDGVNRKLAAEIWKSVRRERDRSFAERLMLSAVAKAARFSKQMAPKNRSKREVPTVLAPMSARQMSARQTRRIASAARREEPRNAMTPAMTLRPLRALR